MTVDELARQLREVQHHGHGGVEVVIEDSCCGCSNAIESVMFVDDRIQDVLGKEVPQPAVLVIEG